MENRRIGMDDFPYLDKKYKRDSLQKLNIAGKKIAVELKYLPSYRHLFVN